ncbi:MAG TPA: hypothetical protein DDW30_05285 [Clostridiales bacterium]|nr:hypothetical protein [Clostridiales bacterium]
MENEREKTITAREGLPLYWVAVAANLVPFALCFALFGGYVGRIPPSLIFGGGMTAVGIGLSFLFHAKWEEKRLPWLFSVCCLGAAKGGCAAALFTKLEMTPDGFSENLRLAVWAAGIALLACVLFLLPTVFSPEGTVAQILTVFLPVCAVIAAIVLLATLRGLFFGLLLLNLLAVALCSAVLWFSWDSGAEARFILSTASMLYAVLLFFVALCALSEGECCDGADCDCPFECCEYEKKKKR